MCVFRVDHWYWTTNWCAVKKTTASHPSFWFEEQWNILWIMYLINKIHNIKIYTFNFLTHWQLIISHFEKKMPSFPKRILKSVNDFKSGFQVVWKNVIKMQCLFFFSFWPTKCMSKNVSPSSSSYLQPEVSLKKSI